MKQVTALTLLALAICQNAAFAGEMINESRDVAEDALINIEMINGTVTITGWDNKVFHVEGELSEAARGFELRSSKSSIRFEENIERRSNWNWRNYNRDDEANLDIQVPRNSIVHFEGTNTYLSISDLTGNTEIEVINGDIVASDLGGVVRLKTVNGSIDTDQLSGRINLETVNGSIHDRNSTGTRVSFEAVNGSIRSNNASNRISASNINGSMELELKSVDDLEVSTVGGSIEIAAQMNEDAQIDISSVSGDIDLSLPLLTSASFHVTTAVGGRIRNQLSADEPVRANRYVNSKELDFVLNSGNGDINISTVSGNVNLQRCAPDECKK